MSSQGQLGWLRQCRTSAQVLVEKAEILKIINRRQVMYMGLEQELLVGHNLDY